MIVLKIFPQTISHLMNELDSNKGVCRTAPATPGLLKSCGANAGLLVQRIHVNEQQKQLININSDH